MGWVVDVWFFVQQHNHCGLQPYLSKVVHEQAVRKLMKRDCATVQPLQSTHAFHHLLGLCDCRIQQPVSEKVLKSELIQQQPGASLLGSTH